ncbi:hypothetical protein VP03_23470 [Sinorhizobium meliloti]|nr:hypothetical protein VP03_23470 [Sinorhizobium meliloti]QGJ75862.1 hypothetical protein C3L21_18805 [Sinorhizobium meliloti]RMI11643.1 hypothetical protein DA101_010245 [Sinorhizobium meliloti]RMI23845.1 hypothetical protein DA102_016185 [Sinorhizobium meliloti]
MRKPGSQDPGFLLTVADRIDAGGRRLSFGPACRQADEVQSRAHFLEVLDHDVFSRVDLKALT